MCMRGCLYGFLYHNTKGIFMLKLTAQIFAFKNRSTFAKTIVLDRRAFLLKRTTIQFFVFPQLLV